MPLEYVPGSEIERITELWKVTMTSSQIEMWPTMTTAPPIMQRAPIRALPAMPTNAAIAVCSPIWTL